MWQSASLVTAEASVHHFSDDYEWMCCSVGFFIWWDWGLNSGLHTCKANTLSLDLHLQSNLFWLFWTWWGGSQELFVWASLGL
jgi:hypothetical protein